ncbi:MAG: N-acetylmuramoyl-L-alanine amidase [Candidatus Pristimantibacillus sp.]
MSFKYIVDHIPKNTPCNRRPAYHMNAGTITVHNTGNRDSTARNERDNLTRTGNDRQASFHIVVDEKEAIECLPVNENAWAAGDGSGLKSGNRTSIHVEICESGDYDKTLDNAAELVAGMLRARGWGVDRLRRHFDWSRKICPRLMYDNGKWTGWEAFKKLVAIKLTGEKEREMEKAEVYVNGVKIVDGLYDDKAGITYVPVRSVAETFGATVKWDGKKKRVDLKK